MAPQLARGFTFLVAIAVSTLAQVFSSNICQSSFLLPNSPAALGFTNEFSMVSTQLHIFPHLFVPCDGYIASWRFLTRFSRIDNVYLGVFRWSSRYAATVELVQETIIENYDVPNFYRGAWVNYKNLPPIPVKAGDFLGFYYSDQNIPTEDRVIMTRYKTDGVVNPQAYILDMTANDVCTDCSVSLMGARRANYEPALIAVIASSLAEAERLVRDGPDVVTPSPIVRPQQQPVTNPSTAGLPAACRKGAAPALNLCQYPQGRYYYEREGAFCNKGNGCPMSGYDNNNFATFDECVATCIARRYNPATVRIWPYLALPTTPAPSSYIPVNQVILVPPQIPQQELTRMNNVIQTIPESYNGNLDGRISTDVFQSLISWLSNPSNTERGRK